MVFYFSGIGNSKFKARQIAELFGDELVSINQYLKNGEKAMFRTERPLVFVAPTYAWRLPKVVEKWIRETNFEGSRKAYFRLTCGGSVGNAAVYAKKLCEERKLQFYGLASVAMPNNYVALSNTPDKAECELMYPLHGLHRWLSRGGHEYNSTSKGNRRYYRMEKS